MHMRNAKEGDQVIVRGRERAVLDQRAFGGFIVRFKDGRRERVGFDEMELVDVPPAGETPGMVTK